MANTGYRLEDVDFVTIREDLYDAGYHPEDGPQNPVYGSHYFIVAATVKGARYQSKVVFSNNKHIVVTPEPDGQDWIHWDEDTQAVHQAEATAEWLNRMVKQGVKLDPNKWERIQGCYGSPAWDESLEVEIERAAEEGSW